MNNGLKSDRAGSTGDRSQQNFSSPQYSSKPPFKYSSRQHPCPICERIKDGDCRWNDKVVLCHTYIDKDPGIPGYVYSKAKDIWGVFFPRGNVREKAVRPEGKKEFLYPDKNGNFLIKVIRTDDGTGKKRIWQESWNGKRWVKQVLDSVKSCVRLYRISDPINQQAVASGDRLLIVEGEGKVDLLLGLGVPATCSIGGAGKWRKYGYPNYLEDLKGCTVVLCPDRDRPGVDHCLEIEKDFSDCEWLYPFPDSPVWKNLPDKGGLDIGDWVTDYKLTAAQIIGAIRKKDDCRALLQLHPGQAERKATDQLLLEIAEETTCFHTPDKTAYADVWADGLRETYPIGRKSFKLWLKHQLYTRYGRTASTEVLKKVLGVLEARAIFEGEEHEVYLRLAEYKGKIYLDLGTPDWRAVEVDSEGWRIIPVPPVRFRRPSSLLPLPIPERGGTLKEVQQLLNLEQDSWILVLTWLLFSFYPRFPHPILILYGSQGTGKTYRAETLKKLIDPGKPLLIPQVGSLQNLAIAANNRWVMAYDNLSTLGAEQSDALCRISTGGGFSTRTLYENDEETFFEFLRPQILTGIDSLATRGDMLERSLLIRLSAIPEENRITEAELDLTFEQLQPRIFGTLLTALSQTLSVLPSTKCVRLPRMADYARFAIAVEKALGLPADSFWNAYGNNRQEGHETALESSLIATAIRQFMGYRHQWEGTATELLPELEKLVDEKVIRSKAWAGNPRSLGKALTRLTPDLRGVGIEVYQGHNSKKNRRIIRLERVDLETSETSGMSELAESPDPTGITAITPGDEVTDKNYSEDICEVEMSEETPSYTAPQVKGIETFSDVTDKKKQTDAASLKVGDRVMYRGERYPVYAGVPLVIHTIEGRCVACERPDGGLTTWLDLGDLELS